MAGRLEGKVAVVTASGGAGMGRAVALRFAQEGALVVGCDINVEGSRETVRLAEEAGGRMIALQPLDLRDEAASEQLMAEAEKAFGRIDVLYNNTVWARLKPPFVQSRADFEYTLSGCVVSAWMAIKHAVPRMHDGGSIINVASIAGLPVGNSGLGNSDVLFPYAVGKAAVIRLTEMLAISLAPKRIRVNALSPGTILPGAAAVVGEEGSPTRQAWLDCLLIKRLGEPADAANAALFLASDEASYITGHNLVMDGGWNVSGAKGWPSQKGFDLMNAPAGIFAGMAAGE